MGMHEIGSPPEGSTNTDYSTLNINKSNTPEMLRSGLLP